METIIKVSPSELNTKLLDKIKSLIGNNKNVDVTISLNEYDPIYTEALNKSIYQAEENENIQSFTMEDFMNYSPAKSNE
ncbi:MAG: hypothetical protein ABJB05_09025 [Parafilimonas sp.]